MFAVVPVSAIPPRRPVWKRPGYGPPDERLVIDLEPLSLDKDMELPALLSRGAEFPTGLILDIRT